MHLFNNIQEELISRINKSTKSLKIAVTWFTNHEIFDAILKKLANMDFEVELIVLNDGINNKEEGLDFQNLVDKNGSFYYSNIDNMIHHKFCIIDDNTVITGSYNWTYFAEERNWENIVILNDLKIVNGFVEEFEKIKKYHDKVDNVNHLKNTDTANFTIVDFFNDKKILNTKNRYTGLEGGIERFYIVDIVYHEEDKSPDKSEYLSLVVKKNKEAKQVGSIGIKREDINYDKFKTYARGCRYFGPTTVICGKKEIFIPIFAEVWLIAGNEEKTLAMSGEYIIEDIDLFNKFFKPYTNPNYADE